MPQSPRRIPGRGPLHLSCIPLPPGWLQPSAGRTWRDTELPRGPAAPPLVCTETRRHRCLSAPGRPSPSGAESVNCPTRGKPRLHPGAWRLFDHEERSPGTGCREVSLGSITPSGTDRPQKATFARNVPNGPLLRRQSADSRLQSGWGPGTARGGEAQGTELLFGVMKTFSSCQGEGCTAPEMY